MGTSSSSSDKGHVGYDVSTLSDTQATRTLVVHLSVLSAYIGGVPGEIGSAISHPAIGISMAHWWLQIKAAAWDDDKGHPAFLWFLAQKSRRGVELIACQDEKECRRIGEYCAYHHIHTHLIDAKHTRRTPWRKMTMMDIKKFVMGHSDHCDYLSSNCQHFARDLFKWATTKPVVAIGSTHTVSSHLALSTKFAFQRLSRIRTGQ
eukprot:jgi/Bigna1/63505/fgenesh1_kg.54_\